jgi:hypothetical protein
MRATESSRTTTPAGKREEFHDNHTRAGETEYAHALAASDLAWMYEEFLRHNSCSVHILVCQRPLPAIQELKLDHEDTELRGGTPGFGARAERL